MSLQDHLAILTHSSLAEATPNKKKAGNPLQFYALVAFPPAAGGDLAELAKGVAAGGSLSGVEVGIKTNGAVIPGITARATPIPGIPADWFIIRASTMFAPAVVARDGERLDQETQKAAIKAAFYPGRRVRVILEAFSWTYDKRPGVSFNLTGVMDAGDGERMNIGSEAGINDAFSKYADASAPDQTGKASNGQDNPFGNSVKAEEPKAETPKSDNPFQQPATGGGDANNPFK